MKLVFLDIQGVIASESKQLKALSEWYRPYDKKFSKIENAQLSIDRIVKLQSNPNIPKHNYYGENLPFCEQAIDNMYQLRDATNCEFIYTSDLYARRSVDEINDLVKQKGLDIRFYDRVQIPQDDKDKESSDKKIRKPHKYSEDTIFYELEDSHSFAVYNYIGNYTKKDKIQDYVILDSNGDHMENYHNGRFVWVNPFEGFSKKYLEKTIRILNS